MLLALVLVFDIPYPSPIMLSNCCISTTEEEAYTLVKLFELEKTKSKSLKHYLGLVVGASALVILLLGACTFGAVFVAVKATKVQKILRLSSTCRMSACRFFAQTATFCVVSATCRRHVSVMSQNKKMSCRLECLNDMTFDDMSGNSRHVGNFLIVV